MVDVPVTQQDAVHLASVEGGAEFLLKKLSLGRRIQAGHRRQIAKPEIVADLQIRRRSQAVAEVVRTAKKVLAEVEKQVCAVVLQESLAPAYLVYRAVEGQFD